MQKEIKGEFKYKRSEINTRRTKKAIRMCGVKITCSVSREKEYINLGGGMEVCF
jgi:hypothetical protein